MQYKRARREYTGGVVPLRMELGQHGQHAERSAPVLCSRSRMVMASRVERASLESE